MSLLLISYFLRLIINDENERVITDDSEKMMMTVRHYTDKLKNPFRPTI